MCAWPCPDDDADRRLSSLFFREWLIAIAHQGRERLWSELWLDHADARLARRPKVSPGSRPPRRAFGVAGADGPLECRGCDGRGSRWRLRMAGGHLLARLGLKSELHAGDERRPILGEDFPRSGDVRGAVTVPPRMSDLFDSRGKTGSISRPSSAQNRSEPLGWLRIMLLRSGRRPPHPSVPEVMHGARIFF